MKRSLSIFLAIALLGAYAAGAPKHKPAKAKAATCSACKMTLSSKKDKVHTVAVKVNGKTMYCCSACKMNKKK